MAKKKNKLGKTEKGSDLFSIETSGDKISYYTYSNNINFRHMLSMDSVLAQRFFETDIYRPSPCDKIDWGLLITKQPLNYEFLKQFEDSEGSLFTIILEYQFERGIQIPAFIISSDYEQRLGSLEDLFLTKNSFAIIPGYLPVQSITKIHFRTETQFREFISIKSANIELNENKCLISPHLFSGKCELLEDKIIKQFQSVDMPIELMKKQISVRNRIKSSLVVAYFSFINEIENEYITNYDHTLLNIITDIAGDKSYSVITETQAIITQLQSIRRIDLEKIKALIYSNDNTPFRHFAWTKRLLNGNNLEHDLSDQLQLAHENMEEFLDATSYKILLSLLCNSKSDSFDPKSLLRDYYQEFRERLPHLIEEKNSSEFDQLNLRYQKAINSIINVLDGLGGKIVDLLMNWPKNFSTLKGLLIFLTAYSPNDYEKLKDKLEKFPLHSFEKRMIWSFYGMLNGMAPLGYEVKKNFKLLKSIDVVTALAFNFNNIPRKPYGEAVYEKRPASIRYQKAEEEEIAIITNFGIEFTISILNKTASLWKKVKAHLNEKKSELGLKEFFLKCPESEPYRHYRVQVTNFTYDKGDIVFEMEPTIRTEWKNWTDFKNDFLHDQHSFEKFTNESLRKLSNFTNN